MEDVALWNLVLEGDMKAMSVLYKRHYDLLFNFGLKYVQNDDFVKDCIQDVFVKLCTSKHLSHTDYVRSYFLTSLKHTISDKLSSLKPLEELSEHSFNLSIEDTALSVLFKDGDEELGIGQRLVSAYKSLPDNQRIAIYLRYIKGLSYKEIAVLLDINPQSSMNLVSRALANLRSKMSLEDYLLVLILFFTRLYRFFNFL
ncbi:RNA polymerase sigma factor [Bacteroides xylanisolvens]|uniref:RNA polymerase sigma factor n=1 Tax=Bacteroides xylanisolvens TaxID=371601 RepID=UPI001896D21D|nr:sigma-70 family RNA polymerase sigma factor [Bacteroides xylanisolvens]